MTDFFAESVFFGAVISILAYWIGTAIQKRWKYAIFNPMLIAIVIIILVLMVMGIDYDVYNKGAEYITYFLTPATGCFAIPLYEQYERLKKNWRAILTGTLAGVLSSLASILLLSALFCLSHEQYVSLLPKSITTAIGIALSGELGGMLKHAKYPSFKWPLRQFMDYMIKEMDKLGVHVKLNTTATRELLEQENYQVLALALGAEPSSLPLPGKEEGAISSLSIVVCGLLTVLAASVFAGLY